MTKEKKNKKKREKEKRQKMKKRVERENKVHRREGLWREAVINEKWDGLPMTHG